MNVAADAACAPLVFHVTLADTKGAELVKVLGIPWTMRIGALGVPGVPHEVGARGHR